MKKTIGLILFLLLACGSISFSQKIFTINYCQEKAKENYPLIKRYDLINKSSQYNIENIGKAYLPQISLSAQASYQNSVTKIPIQIPGYNIPSASKDQYKAIVDVNQLLWDGGNTKNLENENRASKKVEEASTEVSLYGIKERVNQLFFGILNANENLKLLDILDNNLNSTLKEIEAYKKNGVAMRSDEDVVKVEILNNEQKRNELIFNKKAYLEMLSQFINEAINANDSLNMPLIANAADDTILSRPEINWYKSQRELYDTQEKLLQSKNLPRIGLFAEGGYGRPGLNMLDNHFNFFALGGLKISWNLGMLYTKTNEKKILENQKNDVNIQEKTFMFNTNLQMSQQKNESEKLLNLISKDDEIIRLRNNIRKTSESKYLNGIYSVSDLVKDINEENAARQNKVLHEIAYKMSIYDYYNITGK